jgi:hypothetical protein
MTCRNGESRMVHPPNTETPRELVAARRPECSDPFGDGSNFQIDGSVKLIIFARICKSAAHFSTGSADEHHPRHRD